MAAPDPIAQTITKWKATAGAIVAGLSYLIGVIPAEGGFADVSTTQWLALVIAVGAAFGIVYQVPYYSSSK